MADEIRGELRVGDRTIPVAVSLTVVARHGTVQSWFGGLHWDPGEDVPSEGRLRLELDDGRVGEVLLLYEVVHENRPGAAFRGVGPLE